VHEITRILGYSKFKLSASEQKSLLQLYLPFAEIVVLPQPLPPLPAACRDVDDEVFIHLALAGAADFLVTGDGDLLALRGMLKLPIVTVGEWKAYLG
jgi:putative PIN family toxin of toxin-antitoxin system